MGTHSSFVGNIGVLTKAWLEMAWVDHKSASGLVRRYSCALAPRHGPLGGERRTTS
jgi:hypothetical protein